MLIILLSTVVIPLILFVIWRQKKKCNSSSSNKQVLPPGPPWPRLPFLGNILYRCTTIASLSTELRRLHGAYGPVVTLWSGSKPAIFIACLDTARRTLTRSGATFAHRPPAWSFGLNAHGVNSAAYGGRWSLLRRNLSSHLASVRVNGALQSSIDRLVLSLESGAEYGDAVVVPSEMFRHAVFSFFASLCFGEGVEDEVLLRLRGLNTETLSVAVELGALHLMPGLVEVACYIPRLWKLLGAQKRYHVAVMTLVGVRRRKREEIAHGGAEHPCYVDTLLELGLRDEEIVSLCWEFMSAASKTTAAALEWIMARLVLHQDLQQKLWSEIARSQADDQQNFTAYGRERRSVPFLDAVVLEVLRLHPPVRYLLPHTTDKDASVNGYIIPKGSILSYGVADIGRDAASWTNPDEFSPQRFLEGGEGSADGVYVDATCSGKLGKMMPFGIGRRACPGSAMSMMVLRSFVESLVARFEWRPVGNSDEAAVDMGEKRGLVFEMRTSFSTYLVVRQHG